MKKKIKIKENIYDIEADEIHQDLFKVEINDKDYFFYNRDGVMEAISKEKVLDIAESGRIGSPTNSNTDESNDIIAPLTGTISSVWVSVGDVVKTGQKVITLIAMKMENEILAQRDGEVLEVLAKKDDVVNKDDILIKLK
jgi:biotin carboxyl carrier protein